MQADLEASTENRSRLIEQRLAAWLSDARVAGEARELFALEDVDGALVGGASLKAADFVAILAAA